MSGQTESKNIAIECERLEFIARVQASMEGTDRSHDAPPPHNADVLATRVVDGIAVITLGNARRIYFDAEMGDALTEALDGFAGDAKVRVVVVTGGAPGYFNRHFNIPALIEIAESLRASGREWPENATYNEGFFDKAMALCESMPKPVIAAISGTALSRCLRVRALLRSSYR